MNAETQRGEVIIEGNYATLKYERRLAHPREVVWKAITDPRELAMWFNNKAVINGRNGGTIDFVTGPAGFHTTGRILVWDPPRVFEHEWLLIHNSQTAKLKPSFAGNLYGMATLPPSLP
jgi:uncharacterized protein YndB with AHSA1/START domain